MKLLVLLLMPCLSLGEVMKVPGFGKCKDFFLRKVPPQFTPQQRKPPPLWFASVQEICQCVWDQNDQQKFFYATLYNKDWKIPIYSAYVFKTGTSVTRCDTWYIEPQLDDANADECMAPKGRKIITNQAVNSDYEGQDHNSPMTYDRGHLYPVQHTYDKDSMLATSTLTNAAPQDACFNRLQWSYHEEVVAKDLVSCAEAYVVTGVVPNPTILLNNKVTVSKYYWRAYCCLKNGVYKGQGYFGPNQNNVVQTLSIKDLQTQLATDYGMDIVIFPNAPPNPPIPTGSKRPLIDEDCI